MSKIQRCYNRLVRYIAACRWRSMRGFGEGNCTGFRVNIIRTGITIRKTGIICRKFS